MSPLSLKGAPIGCQDDFDVLEDGVIVGRIAPQDRHWMWASGHSAATIKRAAHGYEPTREAAMAAFAKSWRRESWARAPAADVERRPHPAPFGDAGRPASEEFQALLEFSFGALVIQANRLSFGLIFGITLPQLPLSGFIRPFWYHVTYPSRWFVIRF